MGTRRAVIYTRISSDRTGAGLGVATQEADCRELADRLGWAVAAVHSDNDLSAYSGKPRPGYRALLADLEAGRADAVVAWHADRLHRRPVELEEFITLIESRKAAVQTVTGGGVDLTTPSGRMIARQLGSVARYETEHSIERMKRAKQRSAEAGTWRGGRRPFGYCADGVTLIDAEAQLVREGTAEILAGASLNGVAKRWNAAGSTTSAGRPWTGSSVRRVLVRPRNAGLMEWIDHDERMSGPAEWPPIVTEQQWRAVRAVLSDPGRRTSPGNARRWLGGGLFRCGLCGAHMRATLGGHPAHKIIGYRCSASGHVVRGAADVDQHVRDVIAARLRRPDLADLLAEHADDPDRFEELRADALALRARLTELAGLYADGVIDAAQLAEGTRKLQDSIADVEREQADTVRTSALDALAGAPDPGQVFLDAPLDRQRAIVAALATVTLLPGRKGRPAGWQPGESYFRPESIGVEWRTS